tara:strand:+ start:5490 stop:6134 length:645 start_codon:yes stop_codon:yes gene_type:complete
MTKISHKTEETIERRYLLSGVNFIPETRAEDGSEDDQSTPARAEGHAALYNSPADLGWFTEEIMAGAFDDVLDGDTRALFNHDPNLILARSVGGQGTLSLSVDAKGLVYSFEIPDTTVGRDLAVNLENGNITQSSFSFGIKEDKWIHAQEEGGKDHRQIIKFSRLSDVSPVTYPAYLDTSVAKRSRDIQIPENNDNKKMDGYDARARLLIMKTQ